MPVSEDFRTFAITQLERVRPVTWRRMFGGVGIYADAAFFAVIDDDVLYFRVDELTRPRYERAGLRQFAPLGGPGMSYFEVPADALEDAAVLTEWLEESVEAARRAKTKGKRKS